LMICAAGGVTLMLTLLSLMTVTLVLIITPPQCHQTAQ